MLELLQYRNWALAEGYFNRMYPIVSERLLRGSLDGLIKKQDPEAQSKALSNQLQEGGIKSIYSPEAGTLIAEVNGARVALMAIIGPLTKYGDLCSAGMQEYAMRINKAAAADTVDAILLVMDSPGGTVDGTQDLALAVKSVKKPVGVFADQMIASAAVWIAAQADVIVANKNNFTQIGSIGTYATDVNYQNVMDAGNLPQMKLIRAPQSTEKALFNAIEETPESVMGELKTQLSAITSKFIKAVKSGRGDRLNAEAEGLFNGRMYDFKTAEDIGLIDASGTMADALKAVAALVGNSKPAKNNGSIKSTNDMSFTGSVKKAISGIFAKEDEAGAQAAAEESKAKKSETDEEEEEESKAKKSEKDEEEEEAAVTTSAETEDEEEEEAAEENDEEEEAEEEEEESKSKKSKKAASPEANVAEQLAAMQAEIASLKAELAERPTGVISQVVPNNKSEAKQAADPGEAKKINSYATSIDAEVAEIMNFQSNNSKIK
jgi:protease IV